MVEQIKRLRGELKESVSKAHRLFEATVEADAINPNDSNFLKFLKNNNIKITKKVKQKGSGVFVPPLLITMQGERSDLEKVLRKYWDGEGIDDIHESVNEAPVSDDEIRKSIENQKKWIEENGIPKDLMKKIEVVIKRALGISKIKKISGPHKSRVINQIIYFFTIGDRGTDIKVTKHINSFKGRDDYWYKASINLQSPMSYEGEDYMKYKDKYNYKSDAELLKGIFNMVKNEKEKILKYA